MNDQQIGYPYRLRDGCKIAHRIVRKFLVSRWIDGQRAERLQQGMTVRRRLGDRVGAYDGACTGAVVDHHLAPPALAESLGEHPRNGVAATARHGRHDDAYHPVGIALRERESLPEHQCNRRGKQNAGAARHEYRHCFPLWGHCGRLSSASFGTVLLESRMQVLPQSTAVYSESEGQAWRLVTTEICGHT